MSRRPKAWAAAFSAANSSRGAVLPNATQMARLMSVSRPSFREALKLLAGKGLIKFLA